MADTRSKTVHVRVSEAEYTKLDTEAEAAGMKLSDLVRFRALGPESVAPTPEGYAALATTNSALTHRVGTLETQVQSLLVQTRDFLKGD